MSGVIKGTVSETKTLTGRASMLFAKDGDSAYVIACRNGFEGTVEEWLESLRGNDALHSVSASMVNGTLVVEQGVEGMITGKGAPTVTTEGAVGELYLDTDTGDLYRCTNVSNGCYNWVMIGYHFEIDDTLTQEGSAADAKAVGDKLGAVETALDSIIAIQNELIGGDGV